MERTYGKAGMHFSFLTERYMCLIFRHNSTGHEKGKRFIALEALIAYCSSNQTVTGFFHEIPVFLRKSGVLFRVTVDEVRVVAQGGASSRWTPVAKIRFFNYYSVTCDALSGLCCSFSTIVPEQE